MKELSCFYSMVEIFRTHLSRQLPSQHISLFLLVALKPGISQADLSRELQMPQGTVSRNVKLLSTYFEQNGRGRCAKGYGLLQTRPLADRSPALGVHLTDKGEGLMLDIVEELRSGLGNFALAS